MKKSGFILLLLVTTASFLYAQDASVQDMEKIKETLIIAAQEGNFDTLKTLLIKYPNLKNLKRDGSWSLLHMAQTSSKIVEYLIQIGADIESKSGALWTPLHSHAYYGNKENVKLLLENGADIEAKTSFGHTPLLSSLRWDRIDITKFLLEQGASVDPTTELGRTPLILSTIEGNSEMAGLFLKNNADICIEDKNYQRTALHFAALYGQYDIVEALVKNGADVNKKDGAGRTPLDYACGYGHEKIANLLINYGADGNIDKTYFGFSHFLKKTLKRGQAFAWYTGHSGYTVKTKNHLLIFNYSHNSGAGNPIEPRLANGRINLDEIADYQTTVFASSAHHSHHHPELFNQWQKTHKDITFVYGFEDKVGRDTRYFNDVEPPDNIYLQDGDNKTIQGINVEAISVSAPYGRQGSGFLVIADGLVIFFGGKHLLHHESRREAFYKTIKKLKDKAIDIDLFILPGNYALGRIFPNNLEGIEHAVKTLKPKAVLVSGGDSTEFVLLEVAKTLSKHETDMQIFCPEHRGDMFILKK